MLKNSNKKRLEGFPYTGPLAVEPGDVLCKVLHRARDVAPAKTVGAVNVVPAPATI